jgi:hypothetical protein
MLPTPYMGKPFTPQAYQGTPVHTLTIPGTIHLADYDLGGAGIAYCHTGQPMGSPASACGGFNTGDWKPAGSPPYRPTPAGDTSGVCNAAACDDNAGLCHMNNNEPDDNPMGQQIMPEDVYPCYTATGEWINVTVQVTAAGTFNISAIMGAPRPDQNADPHAQLDFHSTSGCVSTGDFAIPPSICGTPDPGCTEGYHVWQTDDSLAQVTLAAGTYVMTFNLTMSFLNADYFVFTAM